MDALHCLLLRRGLDGSGRGREPAQDLARDVLRVAADAVDERESSRDCQVSPRKKSPGNAVTPRVCTGTLCSSSTGTCSHGYSRRSPVAHTTVVMPACGRFTSSIEGPGT